MREHPPTGEATGDAVKLVMEFVDPAAVRRSFPSHRATEAVERVVDAFNVRLQQATDDRLTWGQLCDEFKGREAVRLMTVHKSKGWSTTPSSS